MISQIPKPVTVLFLGSLTHSDQNNFLDKTKPHQDQIDFQNPVKLSLIRIPKSGKDIYSRHISITQNQPIKNFEIYYRNLERTNGRYSLLTFNNELLINSTDDILITPKQPIFTDLLVIKGNFTKISICIYGNIIREEQLIRQKCANYLTNAPIQPQGQSHIQIKKDVFEEKRKVIKELEDSIGRQDNVDQWHPVLNDDDINEQQIENICNISQKLLTTFSSLHLSQQSFVVEFRSGLQQISANLAKIFKNKHLGLYYPSYQDSNIQNDLPISVTKLTLGSLDLSLSQQFRGLQILRFMLQLQKHAEFFIQNNGVQKLIRIFVDFFKINSVVLSTYKNLTLQIFISLAHWKKAAEKMMQIIQDPYYHELFDQNINSTKEKMPQQRQRQRSRQKKSKKSRSDQSKSSSDEDEKRKKKDKQKKRNKEKQREKEKKKGKQSKSKQQLLKKVQEPEVHKPSTMKQQFSNLSFYQVLLFQLSRETNNKQLILIKILLQQILQTVTKNSVISYRVSLSTSLLKDIKFIFNPAGEVLNTKSLKQFASCYQPFLNNIQSEGVESYFVSQREKLKNMRKYGIDARICKIINKISLQIASSQCQENKEEVKTPFDAQFIVMMSELIRYKGKSVLYGFGRILNSFKIESSNDIIYLKKIEAAMTMISQYIYKILVQDNGLYTVLNIDQIYTSLINITNCLSKDPSAFTKQLKRKIRQLTNYAMAYDLFNRSQGNFKTISDYFLRLFKFQQYEINKINDFKKKQFDKLIKPFTINNLSDIFNLGNFHELFPDQTLLQIDVYLKIFNILLQYNKNVWSLFYQNKLLCGFCALFIKISNLIIFLLQPSNERESILIQIKKNQLSMQNYLSVMGRLINLLAKKAEYESAFNDLIEEDFFQSIEIYEKSFQLYVSLFNSINASSSLLSQKCKNLAQNIMSMILEIYDKLLQSYELTSHISRQSKIKQLWYMIYQSHFVNLKSRPACLSLYSFFISTMENASIKLFNTYCIQEGLKLQVYAQHTIKGYIPKNDKSIVQNLIISNIFRNDPIIQTNLCFIIKNLLEKHSQKNPTCEKITPYLQDIFDVIESKLKQKGNFIFQSKKQLIILQKMVLFTDILRKLNATLTCKFEEKLVKYLKSIENIKKQVFNQENQFQKTGLKSILKIKINIIVFLKKSLCQKPQNSEILYFIQLLNRNLDISQRVLKSIQGNSIEQFSEIQFSIQKEQLNLTNSSLQVLCSLNYNSYNQSIMLYEVFLQRPYKPVPQIILINLFSKLSSSQVITFINSENTSIQLQGQFTENCPSSSYSSQIKQILKDILIRLTYFLCQLTTIESKEFYSTESRRNAIIYILTEDKQFPFNKFQSLKNIVPTQFVQTLKDYYSYPIIQKPLVIKTQQKKQITKNKGYVFSKSIFQIIMQGEPTAKARYPYIGGPWKGGDIASNTQYTPSRQRNYAKIVDCSLKPLNFLEDKIQLSFKNKFPLYKYRKIGLQLFQLNTKKRTKIVEKKTSVDAQIKWLNIPLVLQNQHIGLKIEQNQMIKKISPSPSKMISSGNSGKFSQPVGNLQYNGMKRLKSPSPPPINISAQNNMNYSQNSNQLSNQYNMQQSLQTNQNNSNSLTPALTSQYMMANTSMSINPPISEMPSNISMSMTPTYGQYKAASMMNPQTSQLSTYSNSYYGSPSKVLEGQSNQMMSTPYLQMQKISSQEGNGPIRSSSSSVGRQSNPSNYGGANYIPQTYSYQNNNNYVNSNNQRMGGYDNRSNSPYQKNYSQNPNIQQNYMQNQRMSYQSNTPGSYYNSSQQQGMNQSGVGVSNIGTGSYNSNYSQGSMMGSNTRQGGYQQMGNRGYNQNQGQYNYTQNYQNSATMGQSSQGGNHQSSSYNSTYSDEQRQFTEAMLLVTELRGTLPEQMKQEKKGRLNQILLSNVKVQNRIKEFINTLK